MPNAAVFTVVFEVYINYSLLRFNNSEYDEKPFFDVIRSWISFRLRSFLYQGIVRQNIQAAVSYKLVSYMWVLTVKKTIPTIHQFTVSIFEMN